MCIETVSKTYPEPKKNEKKREEREDHCKKCGVKLDQEH